MAALTVSGRAGRRSPGRARGAILAPSRRVPRRCDVPLAALAARACVHQLAVPLSHSRVRQRRRRTYSRRAGGRYFSLLACVVPNCRRGGLVPFGPAAVVAGASFAHHHRGRADPCLVWASRFSASSAIWPDWPRAYWRRASLPLARTLPVLRQQRLMALRWPKLRACLGSHMPLDAGRDSTYPPTLAGRCPSRARRANPPFACVPMSGAHFALCLDCTFGRSAHAVGLRARAASTTCWFAGSLPRPRCSWRCAGRLGELSGVHGGLATHTRSHCSALADRHMPLARAGIQPAYRPKAGAPSGRAVSVSHSVVRSASSLVVAPRRRRPTHSSGHGATIAAVSSSLLPSLVPRGGQTHTPWVRVKTSPAWVPVHRHSRHVRVHPHRNAAGRATRGGLALLAGWCTRSNCHYPRGG